MAKLPTITVSLKLSDRQHKRLFEAAKARGYQPSVYAQLLFEAAFAARLGQERAAPVDDVELDEQVRLVFACAGQGNTSAIAKATGVKEALVVRILDAWKQTGRARK